MEMANDEAPAAGGPPVDATAGAATGPAADPDRDAAGVATGQAADPDPGAAVTSPAPGPSDLYDPDRPPFEELPERPRAPGPPDPVAAPERFNRLAAARAAAAVVLTLAGAMALVRRRSRRRRRRGA